MANFWTHSTGVYVETILNANNKTFNAVAPETVYKTRRVTDIYFFLS